MPRNPGMPTIAEIRSSQTHCVNGHELSEENTRIVIRKTRKNQIYRQCKKCCALRESERRRRK